MRTFLFSEGFGSRGNTRRHARSRAARPSPSVAAITIGALLAAVVSGTVAAPAAATTSLVPATAFEIDGNFTGTSDWGSLYGPGTTPGGYATTGVYYSRVNTDLCATDSDDVGGNGEKLDGGPIWDSILKTATPSKSDLKSVRLAAEKVDVNGTINDVVYAAYERCTADNGSMIASLFFDNGDGVLPSQGGNGDYLMLFDFNPSQGSSARLYQWSAGGWNTLLTIDPGEVDVYASQTVGEVAINLTALGILPADACRTIEVGGTAATASGFDPSSSLIDLVAVTPLRISNCADLKVDKTANVADDGTLFGYDVGQADTGISFDGSLNTTGVHRDATANGQFKVLSADLKVGEQDLWRNVISQRDYTAVEDTPLPAGWSLDTIMCTYQDIFAVGYPMKTVTLYENGKYTTARFAIPPSDFAGRAIATTSCTIHNVFTGVKLVKEGAGDPGQDFDFTVGGDDATLKLGGSQTFAATPGAPLTLTEGTLPDTALPWGLDTIYCKDAAGADVGSVDLAAQSATVTPTAAGLITCTFTNNQRGKLVIQKASDGGTGTFAFTGTIDDSITTTADDGTVSGNTLTKTLNAGTGYSVAETPQAGWRLDSIACDSGENDAANITVGAGEVVTCTATNSKLGSLTLTKAVSGVAADLPWSFGFTLSPAATGGGLQTAAGVGNVTSTDVLAWSDLQPGTTYMLTESGAAGYTGAIACADATGAPVPDADSTTPAYDVAVTAGMALTCAATNAARPSDLSLTKTVTGVADGFAWDFDFTLSPAATGGGKQTASGGGEDSDTLTWSNLIPGVTYTIAEEVDTDYTQSLTCGGVVDLDQSPSSVTFKAGLDQHVTCAATNAADKSSLSLTKTVSGVADDFGWSFDFTLDPSATGGGKQTASGTGEGVSAAMVWTDLVPGRQYTLNEPVDGNYNQALSCTGVTDLDKVATSVTFVAGFDQAIVCSATNTAKPSDLTVTKTVSGVASDYNWAFGFLLSPAATGGGAQLATGTGPDSAQLSWTALVPGETYVISEVVNSDYVQALACTGVTDLDTSSTSVTFKAGFNQHITCNALNDAKPSDLAVTKIVSGVASDYAWSFDFTLSPAALGGGKQTASGTGPDSDTLTWTALVPGTTYVISETANADYVQALACTGVKDLDLSLTSVTFVAGFDQHVTCTALNDAKPSDLSLTKTASGVAEDYAWSFDFTLTPQGGTAVPRTLAGVGGAEAKASWSGLVPGMIYVLAEAPASGFDSQVSCTGVRDLDLAVDTVTFRAGFDQHVTCSATNTARPSELTVTKTVSGVAADYAWSFDFTLAPAVEDGGLQTASGTGPDQDVLTWESLIPGTTYTVTEETDGDYAQTLSCTGVEDMDDVANAVTFKAGFAQDIACEAGNAAKPSELTVTKTVSGVAADYAWSFDFTLTPAVEDGGLQTASGTGPDSDTLTWESLIPGTTYTVTEETDGDYVQTLSCTGVQDSDDVANSVTFKAGFDQDIACEAGNAAKPSELTVTKTVTGVAAAYDWSFDFTLTPAVEDGGLQAASGTGPDSDTLTWESLIPGTTYTVTEETDGDYDQTLSCTGVQDEDDAANSVTFVAGFDQSITCEAGNAAQPSSLTLVKEVTGVADTYAWSFDFLLLPDATGGGLQTASGTGSTTSSPLEWTGLVPGETYSVIEQVTNDYDGTLVCEEVDDLDPAPTVVTFVAGFGQSITCAATNAARASELTVTKTVEGVPANRDWGFMFSIAPEADGVPSQLIEGTGPVTSEAITWTTLIPGVTYTIAETETDGYVQRLTCDGVEDLDDVAFSVTFVAGFGQTVTCAAVNTLIPTKGEIPVLSETGFDVRGALLLAMTLMVAGLAVLGVRRRRTD